MITLTILSLILFGNALSDALQSSARSKPLPPRRRRRVLAAAGSQSPRRRPTAHVDGEVVLAVRGLRIAYPTPDGEVREVVHGVDLDLRRGRSTPWSESPVRASLQIAFSTLGSCPLRR